MLQVHKNQPKTSLMMSQEHHGKVAQFLTRGLTVLQVHKNQQNTSLQQCQGLFGSWAADSAIARFKMGPKMLYFWAGPTMP